MLRGLRQSCFTTDYGRHVWGSGRVFGAMDRVPQDSFGRKVLSVNINFCKWSGLGNNLTIADNSSTGDSSENSKNKGQW